MFVRTRATTKSNSPFLPNFACRISLWSRCAPSAFNNFTNKRASLACAAQLAATLWTPGVALINYKGKNIPKYGCPTDIVDIARKITKFVNF